MSGINAEPGADVNRHPDCEMPDCDGNRDDETHAVRDPEGDLLEMCDGCLDVGWRANVEVLD